MSEAGLSSFSRLMPIIAMLREISCDSKEIA
jgi:hypothetical protein